MTQEEKQKHIVTIGGGTGQFHVLKALMELKKNKKMSITAIPTTIDSGGSSGILRLDYEIVAPGDISQCIYGLHPDPKKAAWLFNHRFNGGKGLDGHTVRNLIVAAALQQFGSKQDALDTIRDTFSLEGNITPITFSLSQLHALLHDDTQLDSEEAIYKADIVKSGGVKRVWLEPVPTPNAAALDAIKTADILIVCPGTLLSSIIPNFLVDGVKDALCASTAKKIYVSNLINRQGHIEKDWTVLDHVEYLETFLTKNFFDSVIANTQKLTPEQQQVYGSEKIWVPSLSGMDSADRTIIGFPLLLPVEKANEHAADALEHLRASVRHDPKRLARALEMVLS